MSQTTNDACADRIRFTLSDASGRLAFRTFEFVGEGACSEAEVRLRKYLVGRPLANVDLGVVARFSRDHGRNCFAVIAAVIREHQELFSREDS